MLIKPHVDTTFCPKVVRVETPKRAREIKLRKNGILKFRSLKLYPIEKKTPSLQNKSVKTYIGDSMRAL